MSTMNKDTKEVIIHLPTAVADAQKTKEAIAVALFNEHIVTKNEAADMVDLTLREFQHLLVAKGIPMTGTNTSPELLHIYESSLNDED